MIRGLYTAASGMILSGIQSDTIDDNVENVRTPGYRQVSERVTSFPRLLANRVSLGTGRIQTTENVPLGIMGTGVYSDKKVYKVEQGDLRKTDTMTDLAFNSSGYFVIDTLDGTKYTRNGHFQIDPEGMLRTAGGNMVLGENGVIGPLPENFTVNLDGSIVNQETYKTIDSLKVVDIPAEALQRDGLTSLFSSTVTPTDAIKVDIRIEQGYVEESNVSLEAQMVKMMQAVRSYSANQKTIQTEDNLLQKAVNEIGRV